MRARTVVAGAPPQHRFREGLIRTAIGRIEHVEYECAGEHREYFHRVT
jgi:hypothetical protein